MNAATRMAELADLNLDLETTMAVMRLDYETYEITAALDAMPRDVLDSWRDTLRLVEVPRKGKSF